MSETLESLTRRTGTMKGIRSIVHTMKTLSAINAHPYEQAALAIADWHNVVLDGLQAFVKKHGSLDQDTDAKALSIIVAFGSDQGLCGNYNEMVATALVENAKTDVDHLIMCVGVQLEDALLGLDLATQPALMTPASVEGVNRLVSNLITRIDAVSATTKQGITVTLAYTKRAAHGQQAVVVRQVLPLASDLVKDLSDRPWTSSSLPYFDMPPATTLAVLLRNYLFASLYSASAEALVTENAARLARMQQAEKSIDDKLAELAQATHTTRQSAITEELLDVIAGFEALKPREKEKVPDDELLA